MLKQFLCLQFAQQRTTNTALSLYISFYRQAFTRQRWVRNGASSDFWPPSCLYLSLSLSFFFFFFLAFKDKTLFTMASGRRIYNHFRSWLLCVSVLSLLQFTVISLPSIKILCIKSLLISSNVSGGFDYVSITS